MEGGILFVYIYDTLIFAVRTFGLKTIGDKLPHSQNLRFVSFFLKKALSEWTHIFKNALHTAF